MTFSQWFSLVCACLSALTAGCYYAFSLFGPELADRFQFTLLETNIIATVNNYGFYMGGPVFGWLVDKYDPRLSAGLAAVLLFTGYGGMALVYAVMAGGPFLLVLVVSFVAGMGSAAAYMAAVTTVAFNFNKRRGLFMGTTIACVGLSAFVIAQVDEAFFIRSNVSNTLGLLLWIACAGAVLNAVSCVGLRRVNTLDYVQMEHQESRGSSVDGDKMEMRPLATSPPPSLDHIPQPSVFTTVNFWLLFGVLLVVSGSGLMYINNLGQIVATLQKLQVPTVIQLYQNKQVSAFSLASFGSRLVVGGLSDIGTQRYGLHVRLVWLMVAIGIFSTGLFGAANTAPDMLVVWTVLVGTGYGSLFTLMPTITSELWGVERFGWCWGFLSTAPAFGSLVFSGLFGMVYDAHTIGKHKNDLARCDRGVVCYQAALYAGASCCLATLLVVIVLIKRL